MGHICLGERTTKLDLAPGVIREELCYNANDILTSRID